MRISDWSSDVCSSDLAGLSAINRKYSPGPSVAQPDRHGIGRPAPSRSRRRATSRPLTIMRAPAAHTSRSEERRVGKECVSTSRSRRSQYHSNKKEHYKKEDTNTRITQATY